MSMTTGINNLKGYEARKPFTINFIKSGRLSKKSSLSFADPKEIPLEVSRDLIVQKLANFFKSL